MIYTNSTIATCLGYFSELDAVTAMALCVTVYTVVLGGIAMCSRDAACRLHDFASECALERRRQNEMIERLILLSHDCYAESSSESSEEQPIVTGPQ